MTPNTIIAGIISIILLVIWAEWLLSLAQSKKDRKLQFYSLLFAPIVIPFVISLAMTDLLIIITTAPLFSYLVGLLSLGYIVGWSITLWKVAGEGRRRWFYLILVANIFWIFYMILEGDK